MAEFSATDAAFTGFRIVREQPKTVAIWAAIQFAVSVLGSIIMILTVGPALTEFNALSLQQRMDPATNLAAMRQLSPFFLGVTVYFFCFYAIVWAAMNRVALRPAESRFAYLRLGRDELRQLGLLVLFALVLFGAEIVAVLAFGLLSVVVALVAKPLPPAWSVFGVIGVCCALLYVVCRLSLASPMTFDEGRIRLFKSWSLTKGRFWPMLGCYGLVVGLAFAVTLLGLIIQVAVGAILGGGLTASSEVILKPDMSTIAAGFSPPRLAMYVVGSALMAILIPVLMTPAAAIYRAVARPAST